MKIFAWIAGLVFSLLISPVFAQAYYYYGSYHPAQYPYYYRPYHPYYTHPYYTHPYVVRYRGFYPYGGHYGVAPYTVTGHYPYRVRGYYPYSHVVINPGHAVGGAYYSPHYFMGGTCYRSGSATICY